jgi:hypothetical protein
MNEIKYIIPIILKDTNYFMLNPVSFKIRDHMSKNLSKITV